MDCIREIHSNQIKLAVQVWTMLKNGCGAWNASYGAKLEDNDTWLNTLLVLSPDQLKRGLNYALTRPSSFPPTVSIFVFYAVMGGVPKKFDLYDKVIRQDRSCKYCVWIMQNITTAFFTSTSETNALQMFDEAYEKMYEYMQINYDVPDLIIKDENKFSEQTEEEKKNTIEALKMLKEYLKEIKKGDI